MGANCEVALVKAISISYKDLETKSFGISLVLHISTNLHRNLQMEMTSEILKRAKNPYNRLSI